MDPAEILGPSGPFSRLGRWEARGSQVKMASAIADTFARGGHLVVEAPTGVGKTLGYLVPSAFAGKRVLVSTHTKTLQDQIVDKDLPHLARGLAGVNVRVVRAEPPAEGRGSAGLLRGPGQVRFALMKGRQSYLCLDRLSKKTVQGRLKLFEAEPSEDLGDLAEAELLDEIASWAKTSPRGDRAELPGLPERSALWDSLDARSDICHGSRCPEHERCFVTRMREEGNEAEIVVVNHHLLLSHLAMEAQAELTGTTRFGKILPDADLLVVDEAHALENAAAEHFGGLVGFGKVEQLGKDIDAVLDDGAEIRDVAGIATALARAQEACARAFAELPSGEGRMSLVADDPRLAGLRAAGKRAEAELERLVELLEHERDREPRIDGFVRRAKEMAASLAFVLGAEDPGYVYWSEGQGEKGRIGASPVDVSGLLHRFLFRRFDSTVMTSATLGTGGDACRFFCRSVGAPSDARTLVLDSPFEHRKQSVLLVPSDAPEPRDPDAEVRMARLAEAAIRTMGGGALFLFTSHRAMKSMYRRLKPRLPYPCFAQGERPKRALIADLIAQAPAVLFATQSFWEGVDVPGDPLRLVLIDKLPFDVPTDPLVRARADRLEAEGKSAFAFDQLPRAILKLRQAFGRLIRTSEDRGAVVLLDGRVASKSYGSRFVSSLPNARRISSIDELQAWWNGGK